MIKLKTTIWTIFLLLISGQYANAQTCCSGGVPLSAKIGMPAGEKGSWQFSLSYDYNQLRTLKRGDIELEDGLRERLTQSVLLQTSYTFSKRFSLDLFLSFVRQERNIFSPLGTNSTITNGIGDGVLLVKYNFTPNIHRTSILAGVGPKIPLGASDKLNENGFPLAADLQPGSGAWDAIFWATISQSLGIRPSMSVSLTSTYRATGVNADYLGSFAYEFGNDFQLITGIADRVVIAGGVWDPSILIRYRNAQEDRINDNEIIATGGQWVFIMPGLNYSITPVISLNSIVEIPLYSFVNNTQLTPTIKFAVGVYVKI